MDRHYVPDSDPTLAIDYWIGVEASRPDGLDWLPRAGTRITVGDTIIEPMQCAIDPFYVLRRVA
ncbi:hypothetical protein [Sphingomonas panni]|uniref:hypothetical protein n=1 Tax=Sphingomonas panni TaxID=237612 RepID=UPI001F5B2CB3|nr:hypothetical protein [Sphingomonas panni]